MARAGRLMLLVLAAWAWPAGAAASAPEIVVQVSRFYQALHDDDRAEGARQLTQLSERLPATSLTLLRARAWFALTGDDDAQAQALYRQLLQRLPHDTNASLNLAIIELRQGEQAAGYQRLRALRSRLGDSEPTLRRAINQWLEGAP